MAYGLVNIPGIDLKPSIGVGVKIPFSDKSVFTTVYTTKEQTKYNLVNYLLSDPRERPFNPTFGAGLRSKIFEHISYRMIDDIKISLTTKVENLFPNVRVTNVNIESNPDINVINIQFSYTLLNTSETDEVSIQIQK